MFLLKCKGCSRLLAKTSGFSEVEIKCPRCKNINSYMSTTSTLPDCLEQQYVSGKIHEQNHKTSAIQS
ncbi:Com family DNA-binding transcriptional regulator [Acinetobacter sp. B5B]|uniref:zinc finger domain-containing protein n=1 Tax=Acinetobacter baretiae TaxID=2605383 RepID=UPI0018C34223|nr:Com family DNA-binding transcriptional regulator [Acinetobacter baretiae]